MYHHFCKNLICSFLAIISACRSNPFGDTLEPTESFKLFTSDFQNQNDGGILKALIDTMGSSRVSLDCAFSALEAGIISDALVARSLAGVKVRVAFDADISANGIPTLEGVQFYYGNRGAGVMRHNFCVADALRIFLTTAGINSEDLSKTPVLGLKIGTSDSGLGREFLREINLFAEGAFGAVKAKTDFSTKFTALDQVIAVYWGPHEDPLDVLGMALADTTAQMEFYATSYQTTHTGKPDLDLPQILSYLEGTKKIPVKKYFSKSALFDSAGQAFTLANPSLFTNAKVSAGTNIFIADRNLASARTFIYTGVLGTKANSADDSVLIELRGRYAASIVGAYLDAIGAASMVVSNVGDATAPGAVVISEINWMGSYSNTLTSEPDDEFIELYNATSATINMSGWKFSCTGGATTNSDFTLPPGALIGPQGYFVVAAKSTAAFPDTNFVHNNLAITNSSVACKLTNAKETVIDTAGDGITPFDTLPAMGRNDAANKTRRSMERINLLGAGNNTSNWRSNTFTSAQNTFVTAAYREQTFASPGAANSPGLVITLANPSFETAESWTNLTAGTLVFDAAVSPQSGNKVVHFNSLTSSMGGREFQSECLPATALTYYTASIYEFAPASNVSFINSSLKIWWYADAGCATGNGTATQTQSTIALQNIWNLRSFTQTAPAGTLSMRMSVRPRYASQAECNSCANSADAVYYDSAAIAGP